MCRATFPIPKLVHKNTVDFFIPELKNDQSTPKRPAVVVAAADCPVVEQPKESNTGVTLHKKTLTSILRKSSYRVQHPLKRTTCFISVPGLATLLDEEHEKSVSAFSSESSISSMRSESSSCTGSCEKPAKVSFDNKVLVQEFRRFPGEAEATWYTPNELRAFMLNVMSIIRDYNRAHYWGFRFFNPSAGGHILHSHPALTAVDGEEDVDDDDDDEPTIQNQIKRILLVDSHDLSLKLFAKQFMLAFPHATITVAKRSQDALALCRDGTPYDIILVEERLSLFSTCNNSGSGVLKALRESKCQQKSLFIGVSLHLKRDEAQLTKSGADFCWGKPPPMLNEATIDEIFQALLVKRGLA